MTRTSCVMMIYVAIICTYFTCNTESKVLRKRQIYREQLLPHVGGKIPDTAFQTDRLFLNHLQQLGYAIPDGVILEKRQPHVFPYYNRASRAVFRVASTIDERFVPDVGKYTYNDVPSVETTYLFPPIYNTLNEHPKISLEPKHPIHKKLEIPNSMLNPKKFEEKKKLVLK